MENDETLVLTVPEAGKKLGLSKEAAYKAAKSGEIPTIRIGHLIKVPKVQLEKLLRGDK